MQNLGIVSLIDTHCHLDIIETQGQLPELSLEKAKKEQISGILQIGIDENSNFRAKELAHGLSSPDLEIHYSIGCHPTEVHEFPKSDSILAFAKQNLLDPKLSAIGEIGIDLYHEKESILEQRETFQIFLEFAREQKIPVVIHSRDGFEETYALLKEFPGVFGVIHCFTYDYEKAKKFIDLGFYISFSGIVTFKSAKDIQEAAKNIPLETLLIETDAPFLAPSPFRGKRNEPAYVTYVMNHIQELRSEEKDLIVSKVYHNSKKFLNRKAYHHA